MRGRGHHGNPEPPWLDWEERACASCGDAFFSRDGEDVCEDCDDWLACERAEADREPSPRSGEEGRTDG